jgi:hypothetical protein
MDPVLNGVASLYVGGELEVQNGQEGYLYRGKIASLEFIPADDHNGAVLKATLEWNAKADGKRLGGGFVPTNGWDEDTVLDYSCNTDLPDLENVDGPNIPNVIFQTVEGMLRLIISNPYTGETTVLYPKDGSKLNQDNVRWLADGPKAKAEAARS